jgi:hypothetical protein
VKDSWDECSVDTQAQIIAFDQIMQHDENEREAQLAGARMPFGSAKAPPKPGGKRR